MAVRANMLRNRPTTMSLERAAGASYPRTSGAKTSQMPRTMLNRRAHMVASFDQGGEGHARWRQRAPGRLPVPSGGERASYPRGNPSESRSREKKNSRKIEIQTRDV